MNAPATTSSLAIDLHPGPAVTDALPSDLRPAAARLREALRFETDTRGWHCRIELPPLTAGALLVPSLVLADCLPDAYVMRLEWADEGIDLAPIRVGDDATLLAPKAHMELVVGADGAGARGGLDCVETRDAIPTSCLTIRGSGAPPVDAVLLVSVRPRRIVVHDDGAIAPPLAVPGLSQMTRPAEFARHVCSPMAVAMVLAAAGRRVDPEAFARACEHPDHGHLFGMWPLNLARARREGFAGFVRLFESVAEAAALLEAGHPIVTSIRFEAGALAGAPLARTGGHLVVLRGLDEESVFVNDPAAPNDDEVTRRYDRASFLQAWLADRGVGYVLWPHRVSSDGTP